MDISLGGITGANMYTRRLGRALSWGEKYSTFMILVTLIVIFSLLSPHFMTTTNVRNIVIRVSIMLVVAVGMTLVLISGGIDLSVGSVAVMSSMIVGTILKDHGISAVPIAILAALGAGALVGLTNGLFIGLFGVPPFIMTMAMMMIARSLAEFIQRGVVPDVPVEFSRFFMTNIAGTVPPLVVIAAVVALAGHLVLSYTVFGASARGVGANAAAAKFCAIPVMRYRLALYIASGVLAGLAGIMVVGRTNSANPGALKNFELEVIVGPIIGGVSFLGGKGTMVGTIIGVLIIGIIGNALNLLGIEPYWQMVTQGAIILAAVFLDYARHRKQ
ncbi:MAG: ABC transporter permease [Chloroflexota bacterium]|jgi:ribose/xylose/arabinose/galactoside ABC-type transport system permease subunit